MSVLPIHIAAGTLALVVVYVMVTMAIVAMNYWKWRLRAKRSYLFTAMEAAK